MEYFILKNMKKSDKDSFICLSCDGIMELDEQLSHGTGKTKNDKYVYKYRRRRFKCPDCGYSELIFSSGERDNVETLNKKRYKNFLKEKLKEEQLVNNILIKENYNI